MESAQKPLTYTQGFRDGYEFVIEVLNGCVAKKSHMNPQVRRVLNQAFMAVTNSLADELPRVLQEIDRG